MYNMPEVNQLTQILGGVNICARRSVSILRNYIILLEIKVDK